MDHSMLAHQRYFRNLRTIRHCAGIAPFDLCALHQCLLLADCVAKLKNELAAKIRVAPGETGI
jgi:hypothetical protein